VQIFRHLKLHKEKGAEEPFSRFAPKTLGKTYILCIYFLFSGAFFFFKRKRCRATLLKKALTENAERPFPRVLLVQLFFQEKVQGKVYMSMAFKNPVHQGSGSLRRSNMKPEPVHRFESVWLLPFVLVSALLSEEGRPS